MIPKAKAPLLEGKRGLVVGIANDQSIAWGCAKAFRALGAVVAVTYLNDKARAKAPSRHLVSIEHVGVATTFLAHDAARLITGETLYIDGGYHIID